MSNPVFPSDDPHEIMRKTRMLSDDIARLLADGEPSAEALATAPILDHWAIVARMRPALTGASIGHPALGDRRLITTTEVFALDPRGGWARTYSRYYRLGRARGHNGRGQ